ncbi:MAG: hypothetical protein ABIK53_07720 [bacterium]
MKAINVVFGILITLFLINVSQAETKGVLISEVESKQIAGEIRHIVANGGFEEKQRGWVSKVSGGAWEIDNKEFYSGKKSLRIRCPSVLSAYSYQALLHRLQPNKKYRAVMAIKAVVEKGTVGMMVVDRSETSHKNMTPNDTAYMPIKKTTSGWVIIETDVMTDDDVSDAYIACLVSDFKGKVWFDDVNILPVIGPQMLSAPSLTEKVLADQDFSLKLKLTNPYDIPLNKIRVNIGSLLPNLSYQTNLPKILDGLKPGETKEMEFSLRFSDDLFQDNVLLDLFLDYSYQGKVYREHNERIMNIMPGYLDRVLKQEKWGNVKGLSPSAGTKPFSIIGLLLDGKRGKEFSPLGKASTMRGPYKSAKVIMQLVNHAEQPVKGVLETTILDFFFREKTEKKEIYLEPKSITIEYVELTPIKFANQMASIGGSWFWVTANLKEGKKSFASQKAKLEFAIPEEPVAMLPPLPEIFEEVPGFGKLKLIDEVRCLDPKDPHLYMEGAQSLSGFYTAMWLGWQKTYRTSIEDFTSIETILGKPCRIAPDWGWVAYKIGRGKLTPGKAYLIAMEYPEDTSRTIHIANGASRDQFGFHTGSSLGSYWTRHRFVERLDYPLRNRYCWWYNLMHLRGSVWGLKGYNSAIGKDGFWFFIASIGNYQEPFSSGAAVRTLKLYEVNDLSNYYVQVPELPKGVPHREIGSSVEVASESDMPTPGEIMDRMRILGHSYFSPNVLRWGTSPLWPSRVYQRPRGRNLYEEVLRDALKSGVKIIPRLEYAGSLQLPKEALLMGEDGKLGPVPYSGKRKKACNIVHPATFEDISKVIDELIGDYYQKFPNLAGLELRQRSGAMSVSFDEYTIDLFSKETGKLVPAGPTAQRSTWIRNNAFQDYYRWWYGKRREFYHKILKKLQGYRADMKLYVNNWHSDYHPFQERLRYLRLPKEDEVINPGTGEVVVLKNWLEEIDPNRKTHPLKINEIQLVHKHKIVNLSEMSLIDLISDPLRTSDRCGCYPPLYRNDKGIVYLAPVHWKYMANNKEYLEYFRTGEGISIYNTFPYNEIASYECPNRLFAVSVEHGGPYCMMEEVLAYANADIMNISEVSWSLTQRGFLEYAQSFAKAFRSLPAIQGEVLAKAVKPDDKEVVARRYLTKWGDYFGIVNKGFDLAGKDVELVLPVSSDKIKEVKDLVTGKALAFEKGPGTVQIKVHLGPVELRSYLAK